MMNTVVIEDKLPFFIQKLWLILEDEALADIIRWDESGNSFHILNTYEFTRTVLPQYFKHKNLNSFVRQLNLYGFRKISSLDRSCLVYSVDTPDDLHFSHPCFQRDHPELLFEIRRNCGTAKKSPPQSVQQQQQTQIVEDKTLLVSEKDLVSVLDEINSLRERQQFMEESVFELARENELLWEEMAIIRAAHNKQQQSVNKLVQFLVSVLQPQKRMGKRIFPLNDEFEGRGNNPLVATTNLQSKHSREILDCIQREMSEGQYLRAPSTTSKLISRSPGSVLQRLMSNKFTKSSNLNDNNANTWVIQRTEQQQPSTLSEALKQSQSNQNMAVQTFQNPNTNKSLVPVYSHQNFNVQNTRPAINQNMESPKRPSTSFHMDKPSTSQQAALKPASPDLSALAHHDYALQLPPTIHFDHDFMNQDFSLLEDPNFIEDETEWNDNNQANHGDNLFNFESHPVQAHQTYTVQMSPENQNQAMHMEISGNY